MNEFVCHADREEGGKDASGRGKDCAKALCISGQLKGLRCLELQVLVGDKHLEMAEVVGWRALKAPEESALDV